ncbi:hypothetical protein E4K64_16610 [Bradyrhizobium frederickii]|uniref:Uncharacterized protein n=1 Tax=Bradyrhizobium frederickii TaxID=2560054 RepID=A0A4Y9P4K4_9BRAD|nr:hypothetical protein [Bradyrhizobium frederickii]TFV75321.1 hypothetical protein E4K64_16610 [Bradyrhizobium frederickii]
MSTRALACAVAWIVALLQATRNVDLLTEKNSARSAGLRAAGKVVGHAASRMRDVVADDSSGR